MINVKTAFILIAAASVAFAGTTSAADKTFRAVGTIQRLSSDMLLLRTQAQDIEITRDAKTKVNGELKYGATATVMYTKVAGKEYATEIDVASAKK